jgi:hypothetical protein
MQVLIHTLDDGLDGKVFRYDIRRSLSVPMWTTWYVELNNFRDIYEISKQPGSVNKSYQGIALISEAWTMQLLTDTFGDVPYSEATNGKEGVLEPAFDKQKDIYLSLLAKLEEANTSLSSGDKIVPISDPVFGGDVTKWRRFGNSLYLRLLLRIAGKADVSAQVIAKIKEIVDTNPTKYPIMQDNTHTAKILWNGTNSSTAVYSSPFMVNIRATDFRGSAIVDFFMSNLTTWNDPRLSNTTYAKNGVNRWGISQGPAGFVGVPSGFPTGSNPVKQAYFFAEGTNTGYTLQTDAFTGIIMNVAEVDFILAEAAARGWIASTGENYYYKGVADQLNYWIPTLYPNGNDAAVRTFATAGDFDWDNSFPLDNLTPGSQSKLQLIHLQKYYALFLVDFQQWFEYRRTKHPFLPAGTNLLNGGKMPARMPYTVLTQSTNPTNYKNVLASQGPDDVNTLVWWQKP